VSLSISCPCRGIYPRSIDSDPYLARALAPRGESHRNSNEGQAEMRGPSRRHKRTGDASPAGDADLRLNLTIRVNLGEYGWLGPGKIALMEHISRHGSISSAGKEMGMSYRRAWLLVDEINHMFREPLVEKQMGGSGGGGARLTKLGRDIVGRYRAIEGASATASAADLRALKASLPSKPLARIQT